MGRRIIVGDIHGCYRALENLIKKTEYKRGIDELILLGDLFDRGEESDKVFGYVNKLKEESRDTVTVLYGNHEEMLIRSMNSDWGMRIWDNNGGEQTKESFLTAGINLADVCAWISENTVPFYECQEFYVCHAGTELENPCDAKIFDLIWDRALFTIGNRYSKLMIIGHTPIDNPVWKCRPNQKIYDYNEEYLLPGTGIINIDTGCVFGGELTAMIAEESKFKIVK